MSQTWFRSSPLRRLSARRAVTTAGKALTAACAIGLVAAIPAVQAPAHAAAASAAAVLDHILGIRHAAEAEVPEAGSVLAGTAAG